MVYAHKSRILLIAAIFLLFSVLVGCSDKKAVSYDNAGEALKDRAVSEVGYQ